MKVIQEPVKITDNRESSPLSDIVYTHPSYGLLQISRISSNRNHSLFGSSIKHQYTICLRVNKARKHRSLSRDWYMEDGLPYVEIEMSAAQFAEAITSFNMGSGVPCTVRSVNGDIIEFAAEKTKTEEHSEEYEYKLNQAVSELKDAQSKVDEILKKKSVNNSDKDVIKSAMRRFLAFATGNSKFYKEQFDEQMEKTVVEAKSEIEAFATTAIHKAGLDAVKSQFELKE